MRILMLLTATLLAGRSPSRSRCPLSKHTAPKGIVLRVTCKANETDVVSRVVSLLGPGPKGDPRPEGRQGRSRSLSRDASVG